MSFLFVLQLVLDWVRQLMGESADEHGGVLVPFGSSSINVGDKGSDIDLLLIVSSEITVDDFFLEKGDAYSRGTHAFAWLL